MSNTIMIVEAATAVPWTKPEELVYDPNGPLPPLGGRIAGGFNVALWEGSVLFVKQEAVPEPTLRALITANGGKKVIPGWQQPYTCRFCQSWANRLKCPLCGGCSRIRSSLRVTPRPGPTGRLK